MRDCRFHLVTVFWTPAGTDPRVLLPSRDVCQHQQLQSGGDGGRHSRLWRGAATLGQEPGGVCAHQSTGKKQALFFISVFCCYGYVMHKAFVRFQNCEVTWLLSQFLSEMNEMMVLIFKSNPILPTTDIFSKQERSFVFIFLFFSACLSPSATSCIIQSSLPEFCCPQCFFLEMLIQRDSVISWSSPSSSCYLSLLLLCGRIAASAKWSNITSPSAPSNAPPLPHTPSTPPLHLSLPAFPPSTKTSGARSWILRACVCARAFHRVWVHKKCVVSCFCSPLFLPAWLQRTCILCIRLSDVRLTVCLCLFLFQRWFFFFFFLVIHTHTHTTSTRVGKLEQLFGSGYPALIRRFKKQQIHFLFLLVRWNVFIALSNSLFF